MKGHGYYSHHSGVQRAAAAPAYPYLEVASKEVPLASDRPLVIGDFGCAGGQNEMQPIRIAVEAIRERSRDCSIEVVHSDLPSNDFTSLFELLYTSPDSYLTGTKDVFALATGRTLYEKVLPDRSLTLGWSAITVHWLSSAEGLSPNHVYSNLTTGASRARIRERSRQDWEAFLRHRSGELVSGGQVVVIGGASRPDGVSGAEGLFELIQNQLRSMVADGLMSPEELRLIYYPTWNRTEAEFLEDIGRGELKDLRLEEHRFDGTDDSDTYPQYTVDGDAQAFADAYLPFVRAITEPCFFRWLSPRRSPADRKHVVNTFYSGLRERIAAEPETATCHWNVVSLRVRRA